MDQNGFGPMGTGCFVLENQVIVRTKNIGGESAIIYDDTSLHSKNFLINFKLVF